MFGNILHRTIKYRYRFLNIDQKEYLLDLNDNKLAFILPFIHIFTGVKAYELTYEESLKIGYDNSKTNFWISAPAGLGILLSVSLRPYINLFDINSDKTFSIALLIFILTSVSLLRIIISQSAKIPFELKNQPLRIKIRPKFKDLSVVLFSLVFMLFMGLLGGYIAISAVNNVFLLAAVFISSYFISITHFSLYRPGKVKILSVKKYE
ncbi:DUF443 family protein [Macrococcus capreoli]|uniref:DUF443 family protein n=1 Tax=Macrococcus capreoli TaxID=2982690 RepID=UPI003EE62B5A